MVSAFLAGLHLLVAVPHFLVRLAFGTPTEEFVGVGNFARVDDTIWRGAAPTEEGYAALATAGVGIIVDLRAEADVAPVRELLESAGVDLFHVPIRDGQSPALGQIAAIAEAINVAQGPVFVHCQAGVGRTGSTIAALRVAGGQSPEGALIEALRFGPMSLEQQWSVLRTRSDATTRSLLPVVAASRVIDSPRRLWSRLTG
jgi:protein-tyrosine phosphatase